MIKRITCMVSSLLVLCSVAVTSAAEKILVKQPEEKTIKKSNTSEANRLQQSNPLQNKIKSKIHGDPHVTEHPNVIKNSSVNKVNR